YEPEGGAVTQRAEAPDHREEVVDRDREDGDHHQYAGDDRGRDHPGRERSADQVVHPVERVEEGEGPESEERELVAVDRPPEDLRHEVVDRGEADRSEPETERVVRVEPVRRRGLDPLEGGPVPGDVDDWKPD